MREFSPTPRRGQPDCRVPPSGGGESSRTQKRRAGQQVRPLHTPALRTSAVTTCPAYSILVSPPVTSSGDNGQKPSWFGDDANLGGQPARVVVGVDVRRLRRTPSRHLGAYCQNSPRHHPPSRLPQPTCRLQRRPRRLQKGEFQLQPCRRCWPGLEGRLRRRG